MLKLTAKQQEILNYIDEMNAEHGFPPTLREICKKFSIASTNGARYHVHRLKKMGYVEIEPGKSRGLKRIGFRENRMESKRTCSMPILGRVPAGPFSLASPDLREDELSVDPQFFGGRKDELDIFGLRVRGDSMTGAGIFDGDIVVVRAQENADDGDIVVARLEDDATVKRLRRRNNEVYLEPANPSYQPIHFTKEEGENLALLGIVVGLIRSI
ncbi:MAG: transcriptional repressor LexA [Candidatus Omnitrophota bacterium]